MKNRDIKKKSKKLIHSFKYAFEGIKTVLKKEQNMKIHFIIMILVILVGILLDLEKIEWIICIILFGIVLTAELFNTAIEIVVDMIMPNKDERAKNAKDISAGAVLIVALSSAVVGILIFVPKLLQFM